MLHNGLAAAERARYGRYAALCNREQRIDNALAGDERHIRRKLFLVRSAAADRPLLHQRYVHTAAVRRVNDRHGVRYGVFTGRNGADCAAHACRYHNLVQHDLSLLYGAENVAAFYFVAYLFKGREAPFYIAL